MLLIILLVNSNVFFGLKRFFMEYLYRYRKFNENTIREILDEELYFSLPNELNDPFDCKPYIDSEGTIEEYKALYKEIKMKYYWSDLSESQINELVEQEFDESKIIDTKPLVDFINRSMLKSRNQVYICCFSENNDDTLMYSHYSDNHSGLCLSYDFESMSSQFEIVEKIQYESDRPVIRFVDGFKMGEREYSKRFLLTKSKCWEHEKEHRILAFPILTDENKLYDGDMPLTYKYRIRKLQSGTLKGLILGCNISGNNEGLIKELIKSNKLDINLCKAVQDEKKYNMIIKPINI